MFSVIIACKTNPKQCILTFLNYSIYLYYIAPEQMRPWINPYLIAAMVVSFALHFMILHVGWMAELFSIVPLDLNEWKFVVLWSFPVILIDEVLKWWGRRMNAKELAERLKQD